MKNKVKKRATTRPAARLNWKQNWLDDASGTWYFAKVPVLNWEYVVDEWSDGYSPGVFFNDVDDAYTISNGRRKYYKSLKSAKNACEEHLDKLYKKFKKWIHTSHTQKVRNPGHGLRKV
jgi:hypothetical protein